MNSFFAIAALLAGATSPPPDNGTDTCKLDPELRHSWADFGALEQARLPYSETYSFGQKTVTYIAAQHTNDPDSDTFQLIDDVFSKSNIDLLMIEGIPAKLGYSPNRIADLARSVQGTPSDSEAFAAIRQAQSREIPFAGAEPTDANILAVIEQTGVSAEDMFGFYILRLIEPWRQQGKLSGPDDLLAIESEIKRYAPIFVQSTLVDPQEIDALVSAEGFGAWYKELNGMSFTTGYRPQDAWPAAAVQDPRQSNKLSDRLADIREAGIASNIAKNIAEYDNVLIVYGGSHHIIQKPMFLRCASRAEKSDP